MSGFCLLHGDCAEQLREIPDESIDAVVTDPPYELGFMGKGWDAAGIAYSVDLWREVLRVLKPGGHLLSFGAARTYHRMTVAVEDAGFEIRDSIHWIYGSGMPKSHDISKAIDKAAGAERPVIGQYQLPNGKGWNLKQADAPTGDESGSTFTASGRRTLAITGPATEEAATWDGWGTALKPAHEPIVVARKPLVGTTVENVLKHGVGGLNVKATRVGDEARVNVPAGNKAGGTALNMGVYGMPQDAQPTAAIGRWPPNVAVDEAAAGALGDAAEFFPVFRYEKKAARKEREAGIERNTHPTVKPVELMRWLVKLVTPPQGVVLDPFMGSGTTGVACMKDGFKFVGVERELEYLEIAQARIENACGQ